MTYALECPVHFLSEHRTDMSPQPYLGKAKTWLAVTKQLYKQYCSGGVELKNMMGAKNTLQDRALLVLERCGA